jgi:hypothetical protein
MKVLGWMRRLDFFGEQFHMKLNGEEKTRTNIGFIFTMIFYVVVALCIWWFVSDYFDWKDPDSQTSQIVGNEYPLQHINKDMFFTFFLLQTNNKFVSATDYKNYVSATYSLVKYTRPSSSSIGQTFSKSATSIAVVPCSRTSWYKQKASSILTPNEMINFDNFALCPDSDSVDIQLYGGNELAEYTQFVLSVTVPDAANPTTVPIGSSNLVLWPMALETGYNKSNLEEPLHLIRNFKTRVALAAGLSKTVEYMISTAVASSTGGFLGQEFQVNRGSYIESEMEDVYVVPTTEPRLLDMTFQSSRIFTQHTRSYIPVFSLISNIGGVIEIVAFLVTIFYSPISSYFSKKNLVRYGIMRKTESTNLLENTGDPKDPESYDFENLLRLKLINMKILKPKNDIEKRRAQFLTSCENLAVERCDIYKIIKNLNELIFFKNLFFTKAHRKLAPIVGIALLEEFDVKNRSKQIDNMSVTDAIQLLSGSEDENPIQQEVSKLFKELLRRDEVRRQAEEEELLRKKTVALTSNLSPIKVTDHQSKIASGIVSEANVSNPQTHDFPNTTSINMHLAQEAPPEDNVKRRRRTSSITMMIHAQKGKSSRLIGGAKLGKPPRPVIEIVDAKEAGHNQHVHKKDEHSGFHDDIHGVNAGKGLSQPSTKQQHKLHIPLPDDDNDDIKQD